MIRDDPDILEGRVQAIRDLPWPIPTLTIMQMTDLDLDELDMGSRITSVLERAERHRNPNRKRGGMSTDKASERR